MDNSSQNKAPEIWALLDGVSGHDSQVLGVVEALGLRFSKKKIAYNDSANKANFLKFDGLATIDKKKSDIISAPWPDIIVSCGRKAGAVARSIKKKARKAGTKTFAAHILWPGSTFGFDLIACPQHDIIPFPFSGSKKLYRFLGSPNRISKEFLLNEYRIWARTIGELPSPRIAVLVGGDSKKTSFTEAHAKFLSEQVVQLCSKFKTAVMVTTSRRTNETVASYLESELKRRIGRYLHFHDFNKTKANPFYAFLQLADIIIVTGDSVSMCSESCSTGKPVYIFAPEGSASEKHLEFHRALYEKGYAQEFNEEVSDKILLTGIPENNSANKALNSADDIAEEIKTRSRLFL
jgi:uncharacterized protein